MTALLQVTSLSKIFVRPGALLRSSARPVQAVKNLSFAVAAGETLALVGESASGKSTTARMVMRLLAPSAGTILLNGDDITHARGKSLRRAHAQMQMVFQDPTGALDPRMTAGATLEEVLALRHGGCPRAHHARAAALAKSVGLSDHHLALRPRLLSGGQRQRVGIARAMAAEPALIVCDEPVSALDVSIQAHIINLLRDLQLDRGISYLFISHDLDVVHHIADRVLVLYRGHEVESGSKQQVFGSPHHPYTRLLLTASRGAPASGLTVPAPRQDPPRHSNDAQSGCAFAPQCRYATLLCETVAPGILGIAPGHRVACHRAANLEPFHVPTGGLPAWQGAGALADWRPDTMQPVEAPYRTRGGSS